MASFHFINGRKQNFSRNGQVNLGAVLIQKPHMDQSGDVNIMLSLPR